MSTPIPVDYAMNSGHSRLPLCVDLDGTLVRGDTLHENALLLLKKDPFDFLKTLFSLLRGIAAFKRRLASRSPLRPDLLPYNTQFVDYLKKEAQRGRRIFLVTAADRLVAENVAAHLGIFEDVLASDGSTNLKSEAKASAIRVYLASEPFEYAGDSRSDIPVWKTAAAAILVRPTASMRNTLAQAGIPITHEFADTGKLKTCIKAMRLYQWAKNLLVFVPLFLSHSVFNSQKLASSLKVFAAFCMAASAVYVVNDLFDVNSDRLHPRKRYRPFAAGTLTIVDGVVLATILLILSLACSFGLPNMARLLVGLYLLMSLTYSLVLKERMFLDVITLGGLYTIRVMAGGAASDIVISPWTLAFAVFFFTSLATCKRLSELRSVGVEDVRLPGRAYSHTDLSSLTSLASSSAYVSVMVLALYLNSPEVVVLYRHPKTLWLLVPILAYWASRTIMIANRGDMHDDPIVFAFSDRASQVVGLLTLGVMLSAI